ncbi:hypothetical protein [Kutzneria buriramensis]|uniref:HTTM-like domain-containing protein n=1 Tax=Kutzneria buriramensis TaxID=1045776 RepID=A0A3E0GV18_9PSEU|nr:hypothetical protein [Kutzneria buriramensis]REH27008.1 hypothetical protein BCF44_13163 [Kutzneria buriramensis]
MAQVDLLPAGDMLSVDKALRETEILISAGIILSSLEAMCRPEDVEDGGLLSWRIGRTRSKRMVRGRAAKVFDLLFTPPGIQILTAMRLTASTMLLLPGSRQVKAAAAAFLAGSNVLLQLRTNYGADGSDHVNIVVCAALAASKFFPNDEKARNACTAFIAGQSVISYFAAGLAKVISPYWRDGSGMQGIFRTKTYGQKQVGELLQKFPWFAKAAGWSVWAGEMAFPLALLAPKPIALGLLGTGVSFHAGNAAFMGLNRFLWAFSATYPAVAHHSKHLRRG